MANENDTVILNLKKKIDEKKKALKGAEKFSPVTNCSLEMDGIRNNIQVLNKEQIVFLLMKLQSYKTAAEVLGVLEDAFVSGYKIDDWIVDLKSKLMIVNRKVEESRLRVLEDKLDALLSNEKKVELELKDIADSLL